MKLYNKTEFLKLPPNTLFMFGPGHHDGLGVSSSPLNVKYGSMDNDFVYKALVDLDFDDSNEIEEIHGEMNKAVKVNGVSEHYPMDLDATSRDGLYEEDALYLVFDKDEVQAIIASLQTLL